MNPVFDQGGVQILAGDCRQSMAEIPAGSVQVAVCSPPYYRLRSYGTPPLVWDEPEGVACWHEFGPEEPGARARWGNLDTLSEKQESNAGSAAMVEALEAKAGQYCVKCRAWKGHLGLEPDPEDYIRHLVSIFRVARATLHDTGTLWVNIADSYAGSGKGRTRDGEHASSCGDKQQTNKGTLEGRIVPGSRQETPAGFPPGSLLQIPARFSLAMQQPWEEPHLIKRPEDRAWLAALIDGEGTISIRRVAGRSNGTGEPCNDNFTAFISVSNTDQSILERCAKIVGRGNVRVKNQPSVDPRGVASRFTGYCWRIDSILVGEVLKDIYPYLVTKKRQALLAYNLQVSNQNGRSLRGNGPLPSSEVEKRSLLKDLINRCNQREEAILPGWLEEPKRKVEPGWLLRSAIVLWKPGPMPESVNGVRWERCRVKKKKGKHVRQGDPAGTGGYMAHAGDIRNKQDGHGPRHAGFNARWKEKQEQEEAARSERAANAYRQGADGEHPQSARVASRAQREEAERQGANALWEDCPGCSKCKKTGGYVLRWGSGRPTSAYEMLYVFAKSERYFWNAEAVRRPHLPESLNRYRYGLKATADPDAIKGSLHDRMTAGMGNSEQLSDYVNPAGANMRNTQQDPNPEAAAQWRFTCFLAGALAGEGVALEALERASLAAWEHMAEVDAEGMDLVRWRNEPLSEGHYAAFPIWLPTLALKAGTPDFCCSGCGAPYAPVVERERQATRPGNNSKYGDLEEDVRASGPGNEAFGLARRIIATHRVLSVEEWKRRCGADANGEYHGQAVKDYAEAGAQNASEVKARILAGMAARFVNGWLPTCSCDADPRPAVVLDMFGGSGSTGVAAVKMPVPRKAILCELNVDQYVEIAKRRLTAALVPPEVRAAQELGQGLLDTGAVAWIPERGDGQATLPF